MRKSLQNRNRRVAFATGKDTLKLNLVTGFRRLWECPLMDPMLTSMQVAALAVAGMCHALLGSIKVPLARKLEIDEARVGGLVSVFGFTLIPMVLVFGFLVDAVGKQAVLGGGFALLIVAMVLLARLKSYPLALIAVLLLGTGLSRRSSQPHPRSLRSVLLRAPTSSHC